MLEQLCREREQDYASLSRMVGRNSAYIQQFIRRGTPRRLPEQERRLLARHFGIAEQLLGGSSHSAATAGLVPIALLDLAVSAGPGTEGGSEMPVAQIGFDPAWLNRLTSAGPDELNLVQVDGDSMANTLLPGDDILVDRSDGEARVRDGIYVLRIEDSLLVKRLTLHPVTRRVTVQSDNPAYADWPDLSLSDIKLIGRVIWTGRRVA
ncbi:S24 family peptidase [Sphingomonas glaciei]|uniref:S24 family peptidase n=1 Tax=Sphingomonas glaciei TaxID=2938948 RepID=A0ABY5MWX6_9SPHN|nr:S24 family peptidase [Sphingomonas glaciei]UUR08481.1 S24 family peptidase [Sphingomonas glaciei]